MADTSPWMLLAIATGPVAITAGFALWGKYWDRRDKGDERKQAHEEQIIRNLEQQRAGAAAEAAALIARLNEQIDRHVAEITRKDLRFDNVDKERNRLEIETDRWSDFAREWKRRAHEVKHRLANTQSALSWMLLKSGRPVPAWPDEALPPLEEIIAANSIYFSKSAPGLRIDIDTPPSAEKDG